MTREIWLISDTHFGHENMLFFRASDHQRVRREFQTVEACDAAMCENWARLVKPTDIIYHLGDIAMDQEASRVVKSLPGHKRLLLGNHDRSGVRWYMSLGFEKIMATRRFERVILSHIPLHPLSVPEKLLGNVHGHIHRAPSFGPRYLNISVEMTNYSPVPLSWAVEQLEKQQKEGENLHAEIE